MQHSLSDKKIFVIQKHLADRAGKHFDLRLNVNGNGWSWAVPKNLPLDNSRRLGIRTANHSIDYFKFEGEIPKGSYGAGTVEIWDNGKYDLLELTKNKLKIKLHGNKINGVYYIIRMKNSYKKWLIFKAKNQVIEDQLAVEV